jgi:hypothetical protein
MDEYVRANKEMEPALFQFLFKTKNMKQTILLLFLIYSITSSFGQKIKVLNFATFHMEGTTDKAKIEYDPKSDKSISETIVIAKLLAAFKPTVICVEALPSENQALNSDYLKFLTVPNYSPDYGGEIELIAYQVGKLAGVTRIYGIDYKMEYNYEIGEEIHKMADSLTYKEYRNNPFKDHPELNQNLDSLSTLNKLKLFNSPAFLSFLINLNADILTYVSTPGNYEGAEEAAKFYRRNLIIFSNLNQIPLKKSDRVFILMGGAHTAFLNDFMSRSPKYELVDVKDYLK